MSVRLLPIKISQWARENLCSYRKNCIFQCLYNRNQAVARNGTPGTPSYRYRIHKFSRFLLLEFLHISISLLFSHSRTKVHLVRSAIGDITVCLVFGQFCEWNIQFIFVLMNAMFSTGKYWITSVVSQWHHRIWRFCEEVKWYVKHLVFCINTEGRLIRARHGTNNVASFSRSELFALRSCIKFVLYPKKRFFSVGFVVSAICPKKRVMLTLPAVAKLLNDCGYKVYKL